MIRFVYFTTSALFYHAELFYAVVEEVQGWDKSPEYAFFEEDVYARRVFYCTDEFNQPMRKWRHFNGGCDEN